MALLQYIDNEVPWGSGSPPTPYGEWDSRAQSGASTIMQSAAASFPERGALGLRTSIVAGAPAYVEKRLPVLASAGVGFWLRCDGLVWSQGTSFTLAKLCNDSLASAWLALTNVNDGLALKFCVAVGVSQRYVSEAPVIFPGRWCYVAFLASWGPAGMTGQFYLDGRLQGSTSLHTNTTANRPTAFQIGNSSATASLATIDVDEVKITDGTYPEPYVAPPADEYPSAWRTVVLYDGYNGESRQFADYCVGRLGIPRANLVRVELDDQEVEVLADYDAFQTQVEQYITDYFDLNPTVASNCSCFLAGYGMPGAFAVDGSVCSAVSRLMNFPAPFTPDGVANPLFDPATVARLTKTALGGKHLAGRIDAADLASAEALVDRALAVSSLPALTDADRLYCGDADWRDSLACQHLRLIRQALPEAPAGLVDDACVWSDTGAPVFGAGGSRAVFAGLAAGSAETVRSGAGPVRTALFTGGYAAGVGCASGVEAFAPGPFFEMLRIGGTLAEALAVATPRLDGSASALGSPLMTIPFRRAGYNVYHGVGRREDVDWSDPVAHARLDQRVVLVPVESSASVTHVYGVRRVSSAGVEERNTTAVAYARFDGSGALLPALPTPEALAVMNQPDGGVVLAFTCLPAPGLLQPTSFDILGDRGTGVLDLSNPIGSADALAGEIDFEAAIGSPTGSILLAVRARTASAIGPVSATVRVAELVPPAPVTLL
jgi:hypothetical protein